MRVRRKVRIDEMLKVLAMAMVMMVFGTTIAGAPVLQKKPNPEADRILLKVRQLQIVDQMLPVLLTKDQIKKLLPIIEKWRQKELDLEKKELEKLKEFEPKLDLALKDAIGGEQKTPRTEFTEEWLRMQNAFILGRQVLRGSSSHEMYEKLKEICNEGQLKSVENAIDPRLIGKTDPESLTAEAKSKMWIQEVLLDRASYDILVDMSR